jgi:hypothetical protein
MRYLSRVNGYLCMTVLCAYVGNHFLKKLRIYRQIARLFCIKIIETNVRHNNSYPTYGTEKSSSKLHSQFILPSYIRYRKICEFVSNTSPTCSSAIQSSGSEIHSSSFQMFQHPIYFFVITNPFCAQYTGCGFYVGLAPIGTSHYR